MEKLMDYIEREVAVLSLKNGDIIYHKGILKNIRNNNLILEDHILDFNDIIAISSAFTSSLIYCNDKYNEIKDDLWNVVSKQNIIKEDMVVEWNTLDVEPLLKEIVYKYLVMLSDGISIGKLYDKIVEEYDDVEFITMIEDMILKYSVRGDEYLQYFIKRKEGKKK